MLLRRSWLSRSAQPGSSTVMSTMLALTVSGALLLSACGEATSPVVPDSSGLAMNAVSSGVLDTNAVRDFVAQVRAANNNNQLLVTLRERNGPVISREELTRLGSGRSTRSVLAAVSGAHARREHSGSPVGAQIRVEIKQVISGFGVEPDFETSFLPVYAISPHDSVLRPLVAALLLDPRVEYLSVSEMHSAEARGSFLRSGPPRGSNPIDDKHTMHRVPLVWDFTRGAGAVVGVFDSGLSHSYTTLQGYDQDASYFGVFNGHKRGIITRGFVGRYSAFGDNCTLSNRTNGFCWPYDDHEGGLGPEAHGTAMTGLVGANDNDLGTVGIMPEGLTISMKITANARHVSSICGQSPTEKDTFCINDADVIFALDYAAANGVKVVSMSWGTDLGEAVHDHLRSAYTQGDVLFFAAVANGRVFRAVDPPVSWDEVVGVNGLRSNGFVEGVTTFEDLSGHSGGVTFSATCEQSFYYCSANTVTRQSFGSSPATAVAAGIAGLLRSYHPSESASQIRERLVSTATGPSKVIDAFAALTAPAPPPPLTANIGGPLSVQPGSNCSWIGSGGGGTPPYSYDWTRDQASAGNESMYTGPAAPVSFVLRLRVADSGARIAFRSITVTTDIGAAFCPDAGP